jgi:hypothetical protein
MADSRRALRASEQRIAADSEQLWRANEETVSLTRMLMEAQGFAQRMEARAAQGEAALQELECSLEEAQARAQAATRLAQERQATIDGHERALSERFAEISTLTSLLRGREADASSGMSQSDWLRNLNKLLLQPHWWALLPISWQRRHVRRLLKAKGLFDAEAYLARYPDISACGIEPLQHFIFHGLAEGRHPLA